MDIAERIFYFSALPGGRALTPAQLMPLAQNAVEREVSTGELLLAEGTEPDRLFFVAEGAVDMIHGRLVLGTIRPPGVLGVRAIVARVPMPYECRAREPSLLLEVPVDRFLETMEDDFTVWRRQLRFAHADFASRIRQNPKLLQRVIFDVSALPTNREPDLVERMLLIRRTGAFGRGSANALAELAQQLGCVDYEPGQTFFRTGDVATEMFVIIRGHVRVTMPDGEQLELGPGAAFGGPEANAEESRFYTAAAIDEVLALRGQTEALLDVIEDNPEVGAAFLATTARQLLAQDVERMIAAAKARAEAEQAAAQ